MLSKLHEVEDKITIKKSDLFNNISWDRDETFDLIFFNVPYINIKNLNQISLDNISKAFIDNDYKLLRRYMREGENILKIRILNC